MLFFTLCYINQLPEAQVLGDSIKSVHADADFFIGLIDNKNRIPDSFKTVYPIVEINDIKIAHFEKMAKQYTQNELLANCKPFFARYFLAKADKVVYFDYTTLLFNNIDFIEEKLSTYNIIIVPQLVHAGVHPDEKQILNTGIFHSGFLALKQSDEALNFLDWWGNNTALKGFIDLCKGMNADQLWLEHVPNFYNNVLIEKHNGLNIGVWNLPERKLDIVDRTVNSESLISVNFKGMKYWASYKNAVGHYPIKKTSAFYGLPNPESKKTGGILAQNIRKINSFIDKIVDLI